jgi:ABC-2 type transport system permease protein
VNQSATLAWFARHELRLLLRDWFSLMTASHRRRASVLVISALAIAILSHLLAYSIIAPIADAGIRADKTTLVTITGSVILSWMLMLSQAMESVTRALYARSDLDLILSSPASARHLFAVRMTAIALAPTLLMTVLASPLINTLALYDGPRWLAAYGVLLAMGAFATALAVPATVILFRSLGPQRTRLVSQILFAVVAAAFVIGVQAAAILIAGNLSGFSFLRSQSLIDLAPEITSVVWWPALAAMGNLSALAVVLGASLTLLALAIAFFSATFEDHVSAASGVAYHRTKKRHRSTGFRRASTKHAMRRKEWKLLRRDPWLLSQSLLQVLYLLPPALLLLHYVGDFVSTSALLSVVPILVMASGQLAGGLTWITVTGEDAPDLVASAPISARAIVSAKIEAVLSAVGFVVVPLIVVLTLSAPRLAAITVFGIMASALSGTMIQIWFRAQARRSTLRRRQIPSRIVTVAEALSSILWASTAVLAAIGAWSATVTAFAALLVLAGTWMIRPRQTTGA